MYVYRLLLQTLVKEWVTLRSEFHLGTVIGCHLCNKPSRESESDWEMTASQT